MRVDELVRRALEEDIGHGDLTTELTVPAGAAGRGRIRAKQELVLCGLIEAEEALRQLGGRLLPCAAEGERVPAGAEVAHVEGPYRALLTAERVALNFLMHLSGIATHTRAMVEVAGELRLVDTRKTHPLLRASQRRAVRAGGGRNHRFALYDGILIKDNHIVAAGGIGPAVARARAGAHHLLKIEVEVETEAMADEAIAAGADVLLLDNMSDEQMAAVARRHGGRALLEASGNLDGPRLRRLQGLGLHLASMGGLVHQARWVDLSLRLDPPG